MAEAAAIRSAVDLGVLLTGRKTTSVKEPIYEVTLVQHLFEYLLMYPALDKFEPGWEVASGRERVDIALIRPQKSVLVECKDFAVGKVNADAKKLRKLAKKKKYKNPSLYVLCFWRSDVPENIPKRVNQAYSRKNGLDSKLTKLVASKRFSVFRPEQDALPMGVALLKVRP